MEKWRFKKLKAQMFNYSFWESETSPLKLCKRYNSILKNSDFKILKKVCHHFTPQGFTALFLLSESHLAIHTFPEENKTYIELSSCVERQFNKFLENMKLYNIDIVKED